MAWDTLDGTTLENIGSLDLSRAEEKFGAPLGTVYRVDLHNELLRLVMEGGDGEREGEGERRMV